jgi:hypothetical protein
MKWPWPPPRLGDFVGIAFVLAILGMVVFLTVGHTTFLQRGTNAGFGPDWDCTSTGLREPVCIKRRVDVAR